MDTLAMIQAMKDSIFEVLEQMFFLPIDLVEDQKENTITGPNNQQSIHARVGFDGVPSGTFLLNIPKELAVSITADFLGTIPEKLSMEQITGTVKEMINMLAGNTLSAYDPKTPFDLHIPELTAPPCWSHATAIDIGIETLNNRMTLHMTANSASAG
ncbi:MAG: chemotaxis protein CheX [Desulfobacteraceae bacterium]|jgi:CheY-specific phosphatase CheX